jgi:hypothetical protein
MAIQCLPKSSRLYLKCVFIPSDIDPIEHTQAKYDLLQGNIEACLDRKSKRRFIYDEKYPEYAVCRISVRTTDENHHSTVSDICAALGINVIKCYYKVS